MQQIYDPRISPLFRKSLSDLSPTLVLVAEVDVLHDEALLYYKRLQKEGVPSELIIYKGAYHAFFRYVSSLFNFMHISISNQIKYVYHGTLNQYLIYDNTIVYCLQSCKPGGFVMPC